MIGVDLSRLAEWMQGRVEGDGTARISGTAVVDSRKVAPGDVFFALPGEKVDGHDFVPAALAAGAACAVVRRIDDGWTAALRPGQGLIVVNDGLQALQDCARHYRTQLAIPVIAVTGSTGKTSTKDLLAAAVGAQRDVMKSPGNFNNEIGLPLTLLGVQEQHQALIVEMGMRGKGQIAALCRIARPDVGLLTNIGPVHMELLGSMEAIARAKGELLQSLSDKGKAVVNGEDRQVVAETLSSRCPVVYAGTSPEALAHGLIAGGLNPAAPVQAIWATEVEPLGEQGSRVAGALGVFIPEQAAGYEESTFEFLLPLPGRHQVSNALLALAAAKAVGVDPAVAAGGLAQARLSSLRWETRRFDCAVTLINDAYNANPAAMSAALTTAAELAGPSRLVAVLGDMYELGPEAAEYHRQVGRQAAELGVGLLVSVGTLGACIADGAIEAGLTPERIRRFADAETAAAALPGQVEKDDVILIKASRGMRLERVAHALADTLANRRR
ncbi:udp-n-acetylmuramoylalanyl-d-glutamyl-2, 6-diaminopimelate-d-alanyl-d-alanyl ligase [Heliomicrobium modesticaldum Ice1]|uniref:UDP-N-acetylmuramoyl-tripeptide--D-alanyl-D-alanine ligase n=1 Tax=Heliobacterium modesticaldum (strain ATCC 51547 / Ice1) TaxID=498761 RepID=B0TGB6_HELMI|nr:UDP-N-acetylmuramoyl-tripeptide--D-alanyl-D-alanine ligase [Heliomicrobium modesticaldum]ABZ84612.1 udp-n-acetylmuramoylalanyl-d-glutamyl-2, 6-diaminopimelate-d-alanyl-d-alanyl ligase [Heliomicrobium modesticaldum Ice1]